MLPFFLRKRRALTTLAALLLLAGTVPAPAAAQSTEISNWAELADAFTSSGNYKLSDNFDTAYGGRELVVSEDAVVTLDLNGRAINRGLGSPVNNGYVIAINGKLELTGRGTIAGGFNTGPGGGVYVAANAEFIMGKHVTIIGNHAEIGGGVFVASENGTFIMNGGEITDNTADSGSGGGVHNHGKFTMNGGLITANKASGSGGGVSHYSFYAFILNSGKIYANEAGESGGGINTDSKIQILENPVVSGNIANKKPDNIRIIGTTDPVCTVDDALTEGASIGISMESPGVFTAGLNGKEGVFTSDDPDYEVKIVNGEASLVKKPEDPAVIKDTATVAAGGNRLDLSENVSGAVGEVSYAFSGDANGCRLENGVLISGDQTGDVIVEITVRTSDNFSGKTVSVTVTVKTQETLEVTQEGAAAGDTLPAPQYEKPEGDIISETLSYSGTADDGSIYGPSPEAPTKPGDYEVTVTVETADSFFTGKASFTITPSDGSVPGPRPTPRPQIFRLCIDCELPVTGFSSSRATVPGEQPKHLRYKPAGMHLMLPSLGEDIELVTIPLEGSTWPAAWLGDAAGILEGSAVPGEGVTLIAAHNTLNDTAFGPFALLATLDPGDCIFVRTDKGDLLSFEVYANELLEPKDLAAIEALAGEKSLVLITCENESADGGYLNRRVVFAK